MMPKVQQLAGHTASLTVFAFLLQICSATAQVKPTSAADRMKQVQQRNLLERKSMLKEIKLRNIGPSIMSGRVTDIDVNPDDPTEFYVAYASGGLWYTHNNGQSFTPIFDSEDILTIGDIAVNWNQHIIWVGTGEVNSSRSSYAGTGIYKSTNNGKTWDYLGLPESHHIGKIQLHPTDNNTVWVAVLGHLYSPNKERGVYKTTDGGKTWKQTLYIDNNTGVVDLDINPDNPNELYAAAWYRTRSPWNLEEAGKTSGLYKSIDGGENWQLISKDGSGFPTGTNVGRTGVVVYPKNPQIVYAIVDNQSPKPDTLTSSKTDTIYHLNDFKNISKEEFAQLDDIKLERYLRATRFPAKYTAAVVKEMIQNNKVKPTAVYDYLNVNDGFSNTGIYGCQVYRSDDAGKSWHKTHEKDIGIYNTYGYYFGKIYVSPSNENKVIVFGVPLQLSTDGGKTFKAIDKSNVHGDHHAIWINPKRDNHIIDGNDGGINITYDDGEHWFHANTPPVAQYYAISVDDAKPYNIYGGLQDNGSWVGPSNYHESIDWMNQGRYAFRRLNGGDGMYAQVDTRDNETVYSGAQFGNYARINLDKKESKPIRPAHDLGEFPLRFNWEAPILLSKHNQDIVYIGSNKFHRSLNRGDSIVTLSDDLTNGTKTGDVPYGTLTTIAESPLKFGLLYVGTDDGNVHISKDDGSTWSKISWKLPQGLWVSRVTPSQYKEGRVYVTLNGYRNDHFLPYLFVSNDYGNTWKAIGKDLPFEPLNVIREDPKYDSILYVGSDGGLYVSINAGNSFMMWNGGMPKSVPVHDIAIQERDNEIVIATHGRSLYVGSLDSVQLLLKDPDYRQKKQSEVDRMLSVMQGDQYKDLYKREGIEVECPPVDKRKLKKKEGVLVQ